MSTSKLLVRELKINFNFFFEQNIQIAKKYETCNYLYHR